MSDKTNKSNPSSSKTIKTTDSKPWQKSLNNENAPDINKHNTKPTVHFTEVIKKPTRK